MIRLDGITRENAQVGIDEKVGIAACDFQPARKIVVAPLMDDGMIMNAAFLVEKEKAFDLAVEKISAQVAEKMTLKYVGPIPPCNFVEIMVKW